ncbi:MAG: EF-Tu/IF-2/RF-3 family GTPase [Candidatus Bathyarchaeia archaeon]
MFINKIDRLINELKMSAEGIRSKILRIVRSFNELVDIYSEPRFKDAWKLSLPEGDVIIGSALHKWGLTAKISEEKGVKFSDVSRAYKSGEMPALQKEIPLSEAILKAAIEKLPDPVRAQEYRIPKMWGGGLNSEIGRAMIECDPNGPVTMCITNVKRDPKEGLVATGRIFSGKIGVGDEVYLVNAGAECTIKEVSAYMGPFRENVPSLGSGNIVAISGLKPITAGETIVDARYKDTMVPFERIIKVSEPVITVSIEPKDPKNLPRLIDALNLLLIEDPSFASSINEETGEYLFSGIGELHIDIALKTLREYEPGLEVIVSKPTISYRESVSKVGEPATALSPNGLNQITVKVEPLRYLGLNDNEILIHTSDNGILVSLVSNMPAKEDLDAIVEGFKWACKFGPLCGEPVKDIKVKIIGIQLSGDPEERGYAQLVPAVKRAIHESFLSAGPILLEPIYSIQITAPTEHIGVISNIITKRRGKITSICQRDPIAIINGIMPVAESIELAHELRSASSGRVFWQCRFSGWEKVPIDIMPKIIASVRIRKGLPAELFS